ncbi:hypothetical protein Q4555_15470 [Octadecabacter sp. 1_MG-2023]|uniref:hypothetical protein n=1 Tax=unclassified Octadecabacter TaxID=196158 RepID=UPI001C09F4CD|nr:MULTISPECIES: hypothetical protein [unclassified Octadecabacter]MBU2994069.1 hypothetical protein [Octadecabacter sp. B2R22]MDO6736077.1 hypothetical protein [Octadecabacter sp. 1_MG-2023]
MRIILHLGTYKTGTSTFQNFLFENRDFLLDQGILHPRTGITNTQNLGHRHAPLVLNYLSGKSDACPAALLHELETSTAHTAIISSEAWSNPLHFSHLTRFVTSLEENGYTDITGVLALRNIVNYQVSHYREFIVNQKNSHNYWRYVTRDIGTFNYLFLARTYRSIFGDNFLALPFDGSADITIDLFQKMGFGHLYNEMKRAERANVKSVGPLEVEAMRCANLLSVHKKSALSALSSVLSQDSNVKKQVWTERFIGDTPEFSTVYRKNLSNELDWSDAAIDILLGQVDPYGRNVQEVSDAIISNLSSGFTTRIFQVRRLVKRLIQP